MLDAPTKLGKIVLGMNRALGDIPLTIKVRMGVKDGKNTAHKLVPRLRGWGVSAMAVSRKLDPLFVVSFIVALHRYMGEPDSSGIRSLPTGIILKPASMKFAIKLLTMTMTVLLIPTHTYV